MQKIKIFLASSKELITERQQFEIEIYRKTKAWFDKGIFLYLDIWEDMSARLSSTGSQSEYDKFVKDADLFVFMAYTKVGAYTAEEFENAFGQFNSTKKPFIYTYFKTPPADVVIDESVNTFKAKLKELKHFYCNFSDFNDLWNQFNKELELLQSDDFTENIKPESDKVEAIKEKNVVKKDIERVKNINIGDKNGNTANDFDKKNVVDGSVRDAENFSLGDS